MFAQPRGRCKPMDRRPGRVIGEGRVSADAATPSRRARAIGLGLAALGVLLYTLTRLWHPVTGFGNADIAGILYQADILNDGLLPYRDAADFKSPGAFFIVAAVFRFISREIWAVKWTYFVWALLAAPAMWIGARALYGRGDRGTIAAGGAVLLYLLSIGLFDLNYSEWMVPAYAWAFAWLLVALAGRPRLHLVAGLFAGLAFLLKTHALVLAPTFACVWWWSRRRGDPGATWSAWPQWLAGALLAIAPMAAFYAARGALPDLLHGLVPVEEALAYADRVQPERHWLWSAWKIPLQMFRVFAVQTSLAGAAVLAALVRWRAARASGQVPGARSHDPSPVAPGLIFLAWSVVGCGLGGLRYYIHYLPQYLPALALLAANPAGIAWLVRRPDAKTLRAVLRRVPALVLIGSTVVHLGIHLKALVTGKASATDHRAVEANREVGEFIRANTTPDECIQVWGWAAWPVYYYADRRACSPVFKVLGQVTDANQNSMFTRSRATDFKPGPLADLMLQSFRERPPAYFVRVRPFFPGVKTEPLDQFKELNAIIERDYVLREKKGRIHLLERLDRIPEPERTAAKKKALLDGARPRLEVKPAVKPQPRAPKKPPPPPPPDADDSDSDDPPAQ